MSNYGFTSAGTSYDDEDRLTGFARASGTFTQSWSLTSVGDWNSITTNGTAQNRTHGPTHELLTAGGQSVNTDPKGNITLLPAVLSSTLTPQTSRLSYDFDNKLKSADVDNNGSNDVTFQYDALGRRVARQGTSGSFVYVQHDQQTIADYGYGDAPSSPTHRYVYASYIDEPVVRKAAGTSGTIHYYQRNQQYSITAVTTSSGSVAERYAYTAYGQPTILDSSGSVLSSSAINNRYTYTGREWDATLGLYHFRARWMSGLAGRFMGRDPIGYVDGFELYSLYFAVSNTDAMGLQSDILQPAKVPCRACCCCPDDISVEKVAADPNQGPRTNVKAAIKFSVKVRFSFVNISKQGVSNQDEITCRLRFYEYVYPGSHLVGDYQHGTWNDSVNLMRESRFFQPWREFQHPDPSTRCLNAQKRPITSTVVMTDEPRIENAVPGSYGHAVQFIEVLGGTKCNCKPNSKRKLTVFFLNSNGFDEDLTRVPLNNLPHDVPKPPGI